MFIQEYLGARFDRLLWSQPAQALFVRISGSTEPLA
jgi:hypothetical protein